MIVSVRGYVRVILESNHRFSRCLSGMLKTRKAFGLPWCTYVAGHILRPRTRSGDAISGSLADYSSPLFPDYRFVKVEGE